ncbi:MAG: hypothetical protein ABW178_08280 [Pseudoxanthomonas sp.]
MNAVTRLRFVAGKLGSGHFAVADQLAMVGGNFLMNLILARSGHLDAFGSFSVLYALLVLVNAGQSALIGEPLALSRELDGSARVVALDGQRASLQIFLPVSVLLALHAFVTMPELSVTHALLFVAGCSTCSSYWSSKGRLHALGKHQQAFNASAAGSVVMLVATLVGVRIFDAITVGLLAILMSSICGLVVALSTDLERQRHPRLSLKGVVDLGKAGLPIALLVWVANNVIFLMLAQEQRLADAAGLRGMLTLLLPVNQVMLGCSAFVLPKLAALARTGDRRRINTFSRHALVVSVTAALAFGVVAYLGAGFASRLLLGPQFDPYIGSLRLVAITLPASWACVTVIRVHFQGSRRPRFVLYGYACALAVGVPVAWWILNTKGASAAAVATLFIHGLLATCLMALFFLDVKAKDEHSAALED